jgi:hypothetical protein
MTTYCFSVDIVHQSMVYLLSVLGQDSKRGPSYLTAGVLTKELRHAPYELLRTPDRDLDKFNLRTVIPSYAACIKDNYKYILIMNNYRMCGNACDQSHSDKLGCTVHWSYCTPPLFRTGSHKEISSILADQ